MTSNLDKKNINPSIKKVKPIPNFSYPRSIIILSINFRPTNRSRRVPHLVPLAYLSVNMANCKLQNNDIITLSTTGLMNSIGHRTVVGVRTRYCKHAAVWLGIVWIKSAMTVSRLLILGSRVSLVPNCVRVVTLRNVAESSARIRNSKKFLLSHPGLYITPFFEKDCVVCSFLGKLDYFLFRKNLPVCF